MVKINKYIKEKKTKSLYLKKAFTRQDKLFIKKWISPFPFAEINGLTHDVLNRAYKRYQKQYKEYIVFSGYPYNDVNKSLFSIAIKTVIYYFQDGKEDYPFSCYSWGEFYINVAKISGLYEIIKNGIVR